MSRGAAIALLLGALTLPASASTSSTPVPTVVGVHARDAVPWLQVTYVVRNDAIAHIPRALLAQYVAVANTSTPDKAGRRVRLVPRPSGWMLVVDGPSERMDATLQQSLAELLPDVPMSLRHRPSSSLSVSNASDTAHVWRAFFDDSFVGPQAPPDVHHHDDAHHHDAHHHHGHELRPVLRAVRRQLAQAPWAMLLEGRLSTAPPTAHPPPTPTHRPRPQHETVTSSKEVALLVDTRLTSAAADRALQQHFTQHLNADVRLLHRRGVGVVWARSSTPRSRKQWATQFDRAAQALLQPGFAALLDDERTQDGFLLAEVGAWSRRQSDRLLAGRTVEAQALDPVALRALVFEQSLRLLSPAPTP